MAAFPPLRNSDYVVVSVFIEILSNSKGDAPFHQIAYDYFCGYLDGLCDHLRDVPWEYIFKLSASAVGSGWNLCIYPFLIVNIRSNLR